MKTHILHRPSGTQFRIFDTAQSVVVAGVNYNPFHLVTQLDTGALEYIYLADIFDTEKHDEEHRPSYDYEYVAA